MADWLIPFGTMMIPLALIVRIELGKSWGVYALLVIGFVAIFWGFIEARLREKRRELQEKADNLNAVEQNRVLYNRFIAEKGLLEDILNELKNRGEVKNERKKPK